jgi:hypothetical protein
MCIDAKNIKSYSGSGNIWRDISGNGYYATKTGDGSVPSFNTSGYFDYSANSPATTSTAWGGNGFTLNAGPIPTTGSFTIVATIKRNKNEKALGDRETILSNTGWADGYRFGISDSDLYALIGGAGAAGYQEGGIGLNTPVADNKWHFVAAVFDRAAQLGSYKIYGYIDNVSASININAGASGNIAFPDYTNFGPGYGGCCDAYAGTIGMMMTYNRALTATEIKQNFNAVRGRYGI